MMMMMMVISYLLVSDFSFAFFRKLIAFRETHKNSTFALP